jgi:hypothetical protein
MKALEIIKNGKGIQSITKRNQAAKTANGEIVDLYEIAYYTRQGNVAIEEGIDGDPRIAEILAFNASLPSFRQKRIQSR